MSFGYLKEELERCRQRRIRAWEEVEEFEHAKIKSADGVDLKDILLERAKVSIELFDFLIASLERAAAGTSSQGT